jgi:type IV pilus assembly protein PilC
MPLNAAIGSEVHGIPRRALGLLNAGQRLASLPRVLAMLIARKRIDKSGRPAVRICLLYAGMLLTAIFALLLLYSVVLAPKFMEIFRDFGIQPPTFMRLLSERGAPVLSGVLIACGVLLLIYAVAAIWARFRPLGYEQTRQGFIGWLIWHTPFARIVARDRGLADLCSIVGDGLRAGFSFNDALESALDLAINPALKKKVRRWLGLMQEGEGISDAARRVGLPALVVGMLGTAQLSGGMVETFGFLGRYYETRFSRAVVLFESALPPLTSLACGALVCVIVVNMFLPLIQLIQAAGVPWHKL